jgi:dipeptidyl aminopeptidase/acylaminoacyl peptidase
VSRLTAPFGSWTSPISADAVAAGAVRLGGVVLDGDDVYWIEVRPGEQGRGVVVRWNAEAGASDATPAGTNVRTRVHEYGGAAYVVSRGTIYYSEFADQRLYRLIPGGTPQRLTSPRDCFFADACVDRQRNRLVCVREDHRDSEREAVTTLVTVPLDGSSPAGEVIASGHDFYSTPRFSPDGTKLSWLTWDHPRMPWDGSELWLAAVHDDGTLGRPIRVAGGETESVFQPGWSPGGILYFVSDRTGWWSLYRSRDDRVELVLDRSVDFGRPQWQLGMSTWAFAGEDRIILSYHDRGRWRLARFDVSSATFAELTELEPGENVTSTPRHAIVVGGSSVASDAVVRVDLETRAVETLRRASTTQIAPGLVSLPAPIEFPSDGGVTAHAFHYAPRNDQYAGLPGEAPPLVVISHGGPTASTSTRLNLEVQYWTSRGFAVVDVNYGGSSGYGRAYRERLNGQWGVVDVADCVNATSYLAAHGCADARRLIIRGRSAGGFTTLATLVFRPEIFAAGASYYGVSDLETMATDTHKFESHYLESLVGPYPERRDVYRARSPIHFVGRLACPVVFFQGLEDRIVPPDQSQSMADAMRRKGLRAELVVFPGEQHGFRRGETIVQCLKSELAFYRDILRI